MMKPVIIEYTGKLPSVNHMYGRNPLGGMYLKAGGKAVKALVKAMTKERMQKDVEIGYRLEITANWYNRDKKSKTRIKKRDSNNLIKLILDAACEAVEIEDSQVFDESIRKVQSYDSAKEGFKIELFELPKLHKKARQVI